MNTPDWLDKILSDPVASATLVLAFITLLLALVTAFLAVAAFRSIREQRKERKEDRKERLLNEIIEWSIDIYRCGLGPNDNKTWTNFASRYFDKLHDPNAKIKYEDILIEKTVIQYSDLVYLIVSFGAITGKSHYITKIAPPFGQDLKNAVNELVSDVEEHIGLLRKALEDERENLESLEKQDRPGYVDNIGNHKKQLNLHAEKVLEEATKIKTRDIS